MPELYRVYIAFILALLPLATSARQLEDLHGNWQESETLVGQGRWVVMNVWSPTCSFCVQELPNIRRFYQKNKNSIDVIGLTVDFPSFEYGKADVIRNFIKKHPIEYPLYLADHKIASDVIDGYLKAIPLTVIFHPDGRVLGRWPGEIDAEEIERFIQEYDQYGTENWGLDS